MRRFRGIIQRSFVFLGCLAVLCSYDGRVAGMVLLTVWIPVAVPFLFGNVISEAEGRFYRNLEQYTGKLKDFFGGFEVIQCFQIGKETEELFGSCVKDVEELVITLDSVKAAVKCLLSH